MQNPIDKFNSWWKLAILETPLKKKNAICVSTIGKDGFPNARFVDLKAVDSEGFKFCSHFDSVKGKELHQNPKVALTIWWDHVGLQVRVIGIAKKITNDEAIKYWEGRSRAAQLTTLSSQQSQPMESESRLRQNLANIKEFMGVSKIEKPSNWGGYVVIPRSIEFLTFREDRLHLREHYEYSNSQWNKSLLQP